MYRLDGLDGACFIFPFPDIYRILGLIYNGAAAHLFCRAGQFILFRCTGNQLIKKPAGYNVLMFGGINKLKAYKLGQQQVPVLIKSFGKSLPVESLTLSK